MNLLSPLLLLLFIPLGAVIVVLYLLKLKRKEQVVSSVILWQDAVADIQANAPFQKLKKSLLLILQLLALLVLIGAVARPYIKTRGVNDNKIVVILDSSASMQAEDVSPSRFDDAKSQALDIIKRMGPGDTMLVMTAGAKTRVVASFTSDRRALSTAISGLRPTDAPCNMRQALVLALSLVAGKSTTPPRIVVLSDGGFPALSDLSAGRARLDFLKVGRRCDNLAITGLAARKALSGEQQVFIGLRNFSKQKKTCNLEVYLNDKLIDVREETLAAGQTKQEMLGNVSNLSGRVLARLDIRDDLAVDNTGYVYLSSPRKISVLLVTKGNVFLQNALNLDPRSQVIKADAVPADFGGRMYDLVVFDGITPPKSPPPGGYLLVNTSAPSGPAAMGQALSIPTVIDFSRKHPASAYVDFSNVRIAEARRLTPVDWATTLVESDKGTLAVAGSKNGRSFVQLSFSLLESDFPLRVGFPIFIANCLEWLAPSGSASTGGSTRTGQPMYIEVPPDATEISITTPGQQKQVVKVTQTPVIFENTESCGLYKVHGKKISREFACNLCSSEESNILPRSAFMVGGKKFVSSGKPIQTNRELYGVLVLAALALLGFEWYAYHRRL